MISSIILYFFQTAICLAFFCVLYCLFLRRETFFKSNRLFLLFTLFSAMLIPILEFTFNIGIDDSQEQMFGNVVSASQEFLNTKMLKEVVVVASIENVLLIQSLLVLYVFGLLFLLVRFVYNLSQLFIWMNFNKRKNNIIILNNDYPPFSFMKYMFINEKDLKSDDILSIIEHEKVHIKQAHSIDLIILELLCIVMWINPLVWVYKYFLQEVHEFLADNRVVQSNIDEGLYKKHIVNRIVGGDVFEMANNFGHSNLKKRIMMLGRLKSSRLALLKFLLLFPVGFFLISAFTFSVKEQKLLRGVDNPNVLDFTNLFYLTSDFVLNKKSSKVEMQYADMYAGISNLEYKKTLNLEETFEIVEQKPMYPGGLEALQDYIKKELQYPINDFKNNIEGRVYVNFRINTLGEIDNVKINKSVSKELDAEAIRIILEMKKWKPASVDGRKINVAYTIPIDFEIVYHRSDPIVNIPVNVLALNAKHESKLVDCIDDKVYSVVDKYPEFNGGRKALIRFVSRNVKYPNLAVDQAYEGRVYVSFVVNKYGNIMSPHIVRGVNVEIDNEALRLVRKMPAWTPAVYKGKHVSVKYTLPILFKLNK